MWEFHRQYFIVSRISSSIIFIHTLQTQTEKLKICRSKKEISKHSSNCEKINIWSAKNCFQLRIFFSAKFHWNLLFPSFHDKFTPPNYNINSHFDRPINRISHHEGLGIESKFFIFGKLHTDHRTKSICTFIAPKWQTATPN